MSSAGGSIDPELSERHPRAFRIDFDPFDVPRDQFIGARYSPNRRSILGGS